MIKIVLATRNQNKIKEFSLMLKKGFKLLSLDDIGFKGDIEEYGETCSENAKIKAQTVFDFLQSKKKDYPVLADDSGLFINALNGEPGVRSARYAGDEHNDEKNRKKVLRKLSKNPNRNANFECDLCYMDKDEYKIFVGRTYGEITTKEIGDKTFGYDCLFYSLDLNKTFGEATKEEKDSVSHRARAVEQFKNWITSTNHNYSVEITLNK